MSKAVRVCEVTVHTERNKQDSLRLDFCADAWLRTAHGYLYPLYNNNYLPYPALWFFTNRSECNLKKVYLWGFSGQIKY